MNDLASLRGAIEAELSDFISFENQNLIDVDIELSSVAAALSQYLLQGGKRIRPIFALVGYLGTGATLNSSVIKAAARLELLQATAGWKHPAGSKRNAAFRWQLASHQWGSRLWDKALEKIWGRSYKSSRGFLQRQ